MQNKIKKSVHLSNLNDSIKSIKAFIADIDNLAYGDPNADELLANIAAEGVHISNSAFSLRNYGDYDIDANKRAIANSK